ncbi:ThuA domain-containing protein [Massilia niastensis]|uniref:ThuA domain-containing protein n=1 Tax=Massilia niastensis TaxID=544911 RepID=UPI00037A8AEC|nr:ThuA domain-containing protein [Massilia niastensis]
MTKPALCYGLLSLLLASTAAIAQTEAIPLSDCPLAGQRLSVHTPVFDILANPKARAAVERLAPGVLAALPPAIAGATLPSLSAILPARFVLRNADEATLAAIDQALRALPLGADDDRMRCARYDGAPPPPLPAAIDAAAAAIRSMARENGWQLVFTDRPASFNSRDLARFDAVIWNNVSGDVLSLGQRAAFKAYIEGGGGFVGIHGSSGDPVTFWDWYADTLVGARFKGHPMQPQFQEGRLVVDDTGSEIVAGLDRGWTMSEEWYSFHTSPRESGARVLVTLDERSYQPVGFTGDLHMGDHPIAWTRCVGAGRSFYTAIGHLPESHVHPSAGRLLKQGIGWAAGLGATGCRAGKP